MKQPGRRWTRAVAAPLLAALAGCALPPLQSRIVAHDVPSVVALLEQGASIESRQFWTERTALMRAAEAGDARIVQLLLDRGADPSATDLWKNTPLAYAIWGGSPAVLKLILDKGVDVNHRNIDGWTPLMLAVTSNNIEAVKSLLAHGADVNAKRPGRDGQTARMLALHLGHADITRLLLEAGAVH